MEKRQLLQLLAKLTGGRAAFYDAKSRSGYLTDGDGPVRADFYGEALPESCLAEEENGVVTARIRTADGVFVLDNRRLSEARDRYCRILEEALPFVAQVAGGDVVMYDKKGRRFKTVNWEGKINDPASGSITRLCRQTMEEERSSIGPSLLAPGATAVRIPLLGGYGLAFNNAQAVEQRTRLLNSARQYRYARYHLDDIIGDSPMLQRAKAMAQEVAKSMSTTLVFGETGTGKELFAQAMHNLSPRANQPFVAINCGALPESLVESSLFGYEEGSFTGARKKGMPGVFEQADKGTLFLDEVSEMPLHLQVKLLRVIQEREVVRVGGSKTIPIDVRIVASTNKPLQKLVQAGRFRADLFYRLNVVELEIPPLRARKEDLPALACFFIEKFSRMMGKNIHDITPAAIDVLRAYDWPGNVRELQNCMEHAFNVAEGESVRSEYLPRYIRQAHEALPPGAQSYRAEMDKVEREILVHALRECGGNKTAAANRLGLNRTTLWRMLKKHGLLVQ